MADFNGSFTLLDFWNLANRNVLCHTKLCYVLFFGPAVMHPTHFKHLTAVVEGKCDESKTLLLIESDATKKNQAGVVQFPVIHFLSEYITLSKLGPILSRYIFSK